MYLLFAEFPCLFLSVTIWLSLSHVSSYSSFKCSVWYNSYNYSRDWYKLKSEQLNLEIAFENPRGRKKATGMLFVITMVLLLSTMDSTCHIRQYYLAKGNCTVLGYFLSFLFKCFKLYFKTICKKKKKCTKDICLRYYHKYGHIKGIEHRHRMHHKI